MENEDIKYDGHATIVINESDSAYDDAKPRVINAQEISAMLRYDKKRQEELADLKRKIEHVREYLIEAYDDLGESAQEIADWLDIELTKDVLVTVTVQWDVQLSLNPGDDIQDVIDNLSFSIDTCDEVTDYTEGEVDWTE